MTRKTDELRTEYPPDLIRSGVRGKFAWKPIIYILGANLVFGVLLGGLPSIGLPPMGLVLAIFALVIIASLAGESFKLRDVLILSTILAVGSYLAFIVLLKLQMPV